VAGWGGIMKECHEHAGRTEDSPVPAVRVVRAGGAVSGHAAPEWPVRGLGVVFAEGHPTVPAAVGEAEGPSDVEAAGLPGAVAGGVEGV